tara:strand:+ start:190 stop:309 length:120 start_codon:yes stop_codon:yes gene_type:complete
MASDKMPIGLAVIAMGFNQIAMGFSPWGNENQSSWGFSP